MTKELENRCIKVPKYKCNKKQGNGCLGCKFYHFYTAGVRFGRDNPIHKNNLFNDALEDLKGQLDLIEYDNEADESCFDEIDKDLEVIETTLKEKEKQAEILRILKEKKVNINALSKAKGGKGYMREWQYNNKVGETRHLMQAEFDLLKEYFK